MIPQREEVLVLLQDPQASLEALKDRAKALKDELEFGLARKLLDKARARAPEDLEVAQQLALCTYKDEELLPAVRFAKAVAILESIGLRAPENDNAETLALGGAVYKRRWEYGGQLEHLHESLAFYRAAHERNPEADKGHGGVNAAYILDLLASRARAIATRSGTQPAAADHLAAQAREVRERLAGELPTLAQHEPALIEQYWFVVTLAEVHFGLGGYEEAGRWLARAASLECKEWERQTTFRQLVSIARLQGVKPPPEGQPSTQWHPAWQALAAMLGDDTERALSCYRGKVGLALSGGGLRASLFHLGVLARLADADVLRSVEVLSTVSGGSVVGAHYYLKVRQLLQTRLDADIGREHYFQLVRDLQQEFLAGIQRNLRTRALASFRKNVKMIFSSEYTRSHRLGELYEEALFSRVQDDHPSGEPRRMRDLLIEPAGTEGAGGFKPKFSNWRRRAKVPILLVNATSLNTGHNWQFTASWMGEPPALVDGEVDKNERLRRLYYHQAPSEELQNYRLGHAVAASACVPALFEPLVVAGLYRCRVVRLVDGGVHDNQGVQGLLDEGCTLILASDAAGQMADVKKPSDTMLAVPLRASAILMDRVRKAQHQDLRGRVDSRALAGLLFVHLKQGLTVPPVDWIHCQDPSPPPTPPGPTPYGVPGELQRRLAAMRTDLDSFTEIEAYALMLSGYLMTEHDLKVLQAEHERNGEPGTWGGFGVYAGRGDWPFLDLAPVMAPDEPSQTPDRTLRRQDLEHQLKVASARFLKVWRLYPGLRWATWTLAASALAGLGWLIYQYWSRDFEISVPVGGLIVLLALAAFGALVPALKWLAPQNAVRGMPARAVLGLFGYLAARIHLLLFDPLFLRRGRLQRLLDLGRRPDKA